MDALEFLPPSAELFIKGNRAAHTMHVLPQSGMLEFVLEGVHWSVNPGEYLILPSGSLVSEVSFSAGFVGLVMSLPLSVSNRMTLRSNYGAIGHMSLMRHPVMSLTAEEVTSCRADLERIRQRATNASHLYYEQALLSQLSAHVLDLFDIHARKNMRKDLSERSASLIGRFIDMLFDGEYREYREVKHYASRLCVTPHHLADVCREVSGEAPLYWINRFTMQEIVCLLAEQRQTLTEIAESLNFSSLSHFTRYCQRHLGVPPSHLLPAKK
ncbi:MAG: helix-turn-helix domain-containing protein [Bacteroidales bacterium]|nr:helix-turn-helix domain-containing protein [Bacteroidales bacterium]